MTEELITIVTGAAPIAEVRGAIPVALAFNFSPLKAYLLAVLGNVLIVVPWLWFLRRGSAWLMARISWVNRLLTWAFERTRRIHGAKIQGAGLTALAVFVAIPLPMTGAWSAAILAFLFEMPFWKSVAAIVAGIAAAGAVVLAISLGVVRVF